MKTNIRTVSLTLVKSQYSILFAIIFSRNCISISPSLFTVAVSTLLGNIILILAIKAAFGCVVLPLADRNANMPCRPSNFVPPATTRDTYFRCCGSVQGFYIPHCLYHYVGYRPILYELRDLIHWHFTWVASAAYIVLFCSHAYFSC